MTPTNPPVQLPTAGSLNLSVSNSGGGTMTYTASVTSDTPWLTIAAGGTGTNTGNINVSLAANPAGPQRSGTIVVTAAGVAGSPATVTVVQAAAPPAITTAPQSLAAIVGTTATFNVAASGMSPAYQWRREGTNLVGQTSPTLTLTNVTFPEAGAYSVVVSNLAGTVTSAPATLTVATSIIQPPTAQTGAAIRSTGFTLDLALEVGRSFRVQGSSDLVIWADVTNFVSTVQAVQFVDAAAQTLPLRFYRIVSP